MSRRKVKGLTRTGRQVSEDPDLDNLLSTLSPEEMEELQIDLSKVPDINPEDGAVLVQGDSQSRDPKRGSRKESDPKGRLSQREKLQESHQSEVNERESLCDNRLQRNRDSTGSKAKDMISKLQEKKDDKEKDKREDFRRRDDSKTKDIISKLKEKSEKDVAKDRERRSDSFRTQGLVSKMLEKQNKALENQESKTEEHKTKTDEKKTEERKRSDVKLERSVSDKGDVVAKQADRGSEDLVNHSDHVKEKDKSATDKKAEKAEEKNEDLKGKAKSDGAKTSKTDEKIVNCMNNDTHKSKTKEEDDDEDSSMFDELMEQVRTNNSTLIELNVNNSEVIKTKTLIEFAEALKTNTHVKIFALANCRADDHVAYAIAGMLRNNKTITSLNVDSNLLTGKGILSLIQALQYNSTLTELRFQNQRHICGGKTEMEMVKILKENTTLLKLGYHFELAGPRMTTTNILSRNMDRQRQKRLQEQKQAQANGEKKDTLDVPKTGSGSLRNSPKASPKPSPMQSPMPSPKLTSKRGTMGGLTPPPPPPPPGGAPPPPPPPMLDIDLLKNSLTPVSQRKVDGKGPGGSKNSRDQLLASIRTSNINQLKKVCISFLLTYFLPVS
ncbi:hypothetical protein NL108_005948 [Boleophthalmus pectinirostris]|nr:hypothetical protein NL108_005948 [Boleophthalmus pectinirostris]